MLPGGFVLKGWMMDPYQYQPTKLQLRRFDACGFYICSLNRIENNDSITHVAVWLPNDRTLWGSHVAVVMKIARFRTHIKKMVALKECSNEFNCAIAEPLARVLRIEQAGITAEWLETP